MQKKIFREVFSVTGTAFYVMPISLAVSVLAGFNSFVAGALAFLSISVGIFAGQSFTPSWLLFLCGLYMIKEYGSGYAFLVLVCGGLLYFLFVRLYRKYFPQGWILPDSVKAGLTLGFAFLGTAILTRDYFGISADGNTGFEMIHSYISNGFHANWRGVFYGTISLMLMITWRRKFKIGKKYVPAPFMGVLVPTIMNLFLNMEAYRTPIYEVGFNNTIPSAELFSFDGISLSTGLFSVFYMVAMAIGMFLVSLQANEDCHTMQIAALSSVVASPTGCSLALYEDSPIQKKYMFPVAGTLAFLLCMCSPLINRIPLHSLAVILITLGWQSVDWHVVKTTFKSGILSIAVFLLSFSVTVLWNPCFVFYFLFIVVLFRNIKKSNDNKTQKNAIL